MKPIDHVKRFATNNLLIRASIEDVENQTGFNLLEKTEQLEVIDETYYPQFDQRHRDEAAMMAVNFRIF